MYPIEWPLCRCGRPCMDGKATCGHVACKQVERESRPNMAHPSPCCGRQMIRDAKHPSLWRCPCGGRHNV